MRSAEFLALNAALSCYLYGKKHHSVGKSLFLPALSAPALSRNFRSSGNSSLTQLLTEANRQSEYRKSGQYALC
jgi:hypothetical protein